MTTAVERVRAALASIERTEPRIHAWVQLDADRAISDAAELDRHLAEGGDFPLAGVTVGVKDIFDVAGLPTAADFAPFANRIAARDAAVVARLRAVGVGILGKTVTTQFAVGDPPITRNPWNIDRTPGGSSSGSAAAVAAGHVDVALGSQTAGSTLRPAAYCGIVGFKPTFDLLARDGMLPLAASLDHVGLLARSVQQLIPVVQVLAPASLGPATSSVAASRLGLWTDPTARASDAVQVVFEAALVQLRQAGCLIEPATAPLPYDDILAIHATIMTTETAATHARLFARHSGHYKPYVRSLVEAGHAVPAYLYATARQLRAALRTAVAAAWSAYDVIILPTADTTAPTPETTGNRALQAAATLLGFPAVSLPIGLAADGLPVGLQLIAPRPQVDVALLNLARHLEQLLPPMPAPARHSP